MANIFTNFGKQVVQGDTVKDWAHASRTFRTNNYELMPKQSFLFHVYFDLNYKANILNRVKDRERQVELGMLVKQVSLPKFTVSTHTLNAYNRPHIIQTKIQYDPISIQFHDDSADVVRNFWFDYYSYYYRNSDYNTSQIVPHAELTDARTCKDWGYTMRGRGPGEGTSPQTEPYLSSIRIYSLHNKEFSLYTLYNPIIKSFQHGEHNSSGSSDILQHSMNIEYESISYSNGKVGGENPTGFGKAHYDNSPSPLSAAGGGTKSITGPGGIVESASEIIKDLQTGNIGAAIFKGARVTNGLKGLDVGAMVSAEAMQVAKNVLNGSNNPFGTVNIPSLGSLMSGVGSMKIPSIDNLMTGVGAGASGIVNKITGAIKSISVNNPQGVPTTGADGVSRLPNQISISSSAPIVANQSMDPRQYQNASNVNQSMPKDSIASAFVDPVTEHAQTSGSIASSSSMVQSGNNTIKGPGVTADGEMVNRE